MQESLAVVLIGPQGSGKGTQAALLAEHHGLRIFTMGDFVRDQSHKQTSVAEELRNFMMRGELVPDELVFRLLTHELETFIGSSGVVFDGFPRTLKQATFLDTIITLTHVVHIHVPQEVSFKRIAGRRICPHGHQFNIYYLKPKVSGRCDFDGAPLTRREDDTPENVTTRLDFYHRVTEPVLDHYRDRKALITIKGDATIPAVASSIEKSIFTHDSKKI